MMLRCWCMGVALAATVAGAGCCHSWAPRSCARPAIVNTAPVACPCPDPCAAGPAVTAPAVPAYSSPAPYGNGFPR